MDIIILIFLAYYIGKQARQRGLNVLKWRTRLVVGWLLADILVALVSFYFTKNLSTAALSGFLGAALVALVVFQEFYKEIKNNKLGDEGQNEEP